MVVHVRHRLLQSLLRLVMHHKNFPKSAGTSYRRVAVRVVSGDWRWRGTGWFGHGCTSSGGNVMLITLFAKLKPSNKFYKIHRQTTLHNNLLCAHVLEVFWKMLTTGYLRVNQELGGWRGGRVFIRRGLLVGDNGIWNLLQLFKFECW